MEHKHNIKMPSSILKKGLITVYMPTADPVVDEAGNKLPPEDALELQREQMAAAEEYANSDQKVKDEEEKEMMKAATEKAAIEKTSVVKAFDALKQQKEEDEALVEKNKDEKEKAATPKKAPAPEKAAAPAPKAVKKE